MGVASFLISVLRASTDGPPGTDPRPSTAYRPLAGAVTAKPSGSSSPSTSPTAAAQAVAHAPRRVSFTLSERLYVWLETMAVRHNYGSIHKSVRDLLEWASSGLEEEDLEWLFCVPHELPARLDHELVATFVGDDDDACCIAMQCKQAAARASPKGPVALDAFLCESLYLWMSACVHRFALRGPSDVLEAVMRAAIELDADDDVFESDECGHDLPESTAELYHDLGLIAFRCAPTSPR